MLELIQEVLFYIEDQFEYIQVQDLCRPGEEKRFAYLHKKITNLIIDQLKNTERSVFQSALQVINNETTEDTMLTNAGMMIDAENTEWLVKFKRQSATSTTNNAAGSSKSEDEQTTHITPDDGDYSYSDSPAVCSTTSPKPFTCTHCKLKFASQGGIKRHMKVHGMVATNKCFYCKQCGMRFSTKQKLKNHTHPSDEDKPFECNVCAMKFARKLNLDKHKRMHTNSEKPFKCNECRKEFAKKESLDQHKKVHYDMERPYKCDYCEHRAKFPSALKTHTLIHTLEKPFMCLQCDAKYNRKYILERHVAECH